MKYLTFCLVFVMIYKVKGISDAEQAVIFEIHEKCLPISGATNEMAQRAMTGDFPEDSEFKEHILCISKGLGFFSESGEVNIPFIEAELNKRISDPALKDEIKSKCLQMKATPQETAFHASKCMYAYKDMIQ